MFYLFLANRRTIEGQPDILSPFWGRHLYAFLATVISCLWYMRAKASSCMIGLRECLGSLPFPSSGGRTKELHTA